MGIFDKFKTLIKKENKEELNLYDRGLEKTRKEFTSKLNLLTLKHNKIDDEYFEELEDILITADIGVNTVMDFVSKLKKRVKRENITSASDLKEIIVDEMFIIYVQNDIIVNMDDEKSFSKAIIYYISGMTDNFAIDTYNKIIGF